MIYIDVGQSIKSNAQVYYKVVKFVGQGGNAYVYKVLWTSGANHGIVFALKIQYNLSNEMRRKRFDQESLFLKQYAHPAILSQFDEGEYVLSNGEHYPFIVTTFLPNTLKKSLTLNTLNLLQKVQYSCQLLSAVLFLQGLSILHRDIKPNNIFINNDSAILGDFGLMKKIGATEIEPPMSINDDINLMNETLLENEPACDSLDGYVAMARFYRTPELVDYANKRGPLRLESDVFQLGLVLCEMFTGSNPLCPADDLRAPIQMDAVGYVDAGQYGHDIHNTLTSMIQIDYQRRATVQFLLDKFTGIYQSLL